jgi:hypothetical protein
MANRRTTFGKLQRERDKKAKALEKAEKRAARQEERPAEPEVKAADQDAVLAALAELHQRFDDGAVAIDEFEKSRDELTSRLRVD